MGYIAPPFEPWNNQPRHLWTTYQQGNGRMWITIQGG